VQDVLLLDVDFMVGGGPIAAIANHPGIQARTYVLHSLPRFRLDWASNPLTVCMAAGFMPVVGNSAADCGPDSR
jgi:hypothetical protein